MDNSLLIAVFVPTTDKAGKDFKGKRGELATGYPVEKDLILTARHILQTGPPYYRDGRYPVRIVWHCSCSNDKADWIAIPDQDIVWPSQKDLDAVLIRCSPPRDGMGWGIVSRDRPLDKMEWASEGFPAFTRYKKERCTNRFSGKVRSNALNESCVELTVEKAPEVGDDWKGVSGMPVFVGRKIIGVAQSVPPNFNARKLYATPTWKLLEDEAFRQAIGHGEQAKRIEEIKDKAIELLERSPDAVTALAKQIKIDKELVGLSNDQRTEKLINHFMDKDVRTVMIGMRGAHQSLCQKNDGNADQNAKAASILVNAVQLIVPVIYDYGVVKWTDHQRGSGSVALVRLPAGTKTLAEIIMAGVDGRETQFRYREGETDYPEGKFSLPQMPECGIDPEGAKTREALHDHLDKKFYLQEPESFRRAVDDYLLAIFSRPRRGAPERNPQERKKLAANLIESKSSDQKTTFYMLFYLPQDDKEQNAMRTLVQSLKDDYPAIMFLDLDPTVEQECQDQRLLFPFCQMLPIKSSTTQEKPSSMRFKVALSFPGEYRGFVEQVAGRLADTVGHNRVLYDSYYVAEFARPDLDT